MLMAESWNPNGTLSFANYLFKSSDTGKEIKKYDQVVVEFWTNACTCSKPWQDKQRCWTSKWRKPNKEKILCGCSIVWDVNSNVWNNCSSSHHVGLRQNSFSWAVIKNTKRYPNYTFSINSGNATTSRVFPGSYEFSQTYTYVSIKAIFFFISSLKQIFAIIFCL